jgi:hypothetical protein
MPAKTKPKKNKTESSSCCGTSKIGSHCQGGCFYFLGAIGAAIYYVSLSTGFWSGVLAILKALIWPLFLVLEVLRFLGA